MNVKNFALGTAILVALLAILAAFREHRQAQSTDAALAGAELQTAQLRRQLGAAKVTQEELQKKVALAAEKRAGASRPQTTIGGNDVKVVHMADIIREHPEFAAINSREVRRNIIQQYNTALGRLNLSAEQAAKVKDLLVERSLSLLDAQQAAEANGMARGSPEWQDAVRQATQGANQEINAALQAANSSIDRLDAFNSSLNSVQNHVAPDFTDAGMQLSADQNQAVAQALTDASFRGRDLGQRPPDYNTPDPTTGLTPKENKILTQAAAALTPAQLDLLKTSLLESDKRQAIMNQYMGNGPVMFLP